MAFLFVGLVFMEGNILRRNFGGWASSEDVVSGAAKRGGALCAEFEGAGDREG